MSRLQVRLSAWVLSVRFMRALFILLFAFYVYRTKGARRSGSGPWAPFIGGLRVLRREADCVRVCCSSKSGWVMTFFIVSTGYWGGG